MKLWRISQNKNNDYDTYDSAVVVANSEEEAKTIHPSLAVPKRWINGKWHYATGSEIGFTCEDWANPNHNTAEELGLALDPTPRVICSSFNAG